MSVERRALEWLFSDDTGLSSKAICANMLGIKLADGYEQICHPSDASDLGRCLRLLKLFPEWQPRMTEMSSLSPRWAAFIARWDELAAQMESEVGIDWSKGKSAPQTYGMMKTILGY